MQDTIHAKFETQIILPELAKEQTEPYANLRPQNFSEYPGQDKVCENLKIYTKAAKIRGKMLDHCLFHGPPGLGKTTLAGIVAHEMGYHFKVTSGPVIEKAADLMGILASLEPNSVLFIDEIHRLPTHIEEFLYSAMEDMRLDVLVGQGTSARTVKMDLTPFCLIGATTRSGAISAPLRDRFGIQEHLDYYEPSALTQIVLRSASIMKIAIDEKAAYILASRARGTPRIVNQLLRRVLDFAIVEDKKIVDESIVKSALIRLSVDNEGLSRRDRDFLTVIRDSYSSGPVGLDALAASLNEEKTTLEDVYEPYLVHKGFILRTARGRMLSRKGEEHLAKYESNIQ